MLNGKKLGYSDEIICAAVIRAISPGNNLRTYLEGKTNLSKDSLLEILRSHYKEKDSASTFTLLSNAAQQTHETCLDFVIRLMCLRDKVLVLSSEEGCPYDSGLLNKRFLKSFILGIRNGNIRNELRESCKSFVSDEELLRLVSEAVSNDTERTEKLNLKKSNSVEVAEIKENTLTVKEKRGNKENPFDKIEELKETHLREMTSIRAELLEIKNVLSSNVQPCLPNSAPNVNIQQNSSLESPFFG